MVLLTKKTNINIKVKTKTGDKMRWIILLSLYISSSMGSPQHNDYYDFLQPFIINLDQNRTQDTISTKKALLEFHSLAKTAPKSKEFHYLNYKLMQNFQHQHFNISIKEKNNSEDINKKKKLFNLEKSYFIRILKSIKEPSFYTLYSKLYIETLDMKRLEHQSVKKLYDLGNKSQRPYIQLLSYIDSLNQLNSISLTDQETLHKKLILLLIGLPKKQKEYILRLTALQLSPFYDKERIEFDFNRLFSQRSSITRKEILQTLNFKDAETFHQYIMKEKRSFFEERVFNATMKALKRNDVAKILTTLYMQGNNFSEARSYIRQAPRTNLYNEYNPFSSSIDINNKRKFKKSSNTRKFAETMSRLEERLKEEKTATARNYYLYGNGLYNKSWFGNFPLSSVFFHNEDIYKDAIPPTSHLKKAFSAYTSALELSKKDEFKAEISYQLLKIKFNMARTNKNNYTKDMKKMPKLNERKEIIHLLKASRSFIEATKDYKSDHAHTKYGQRVIQESILFTYL